jgi:hypothetical protein
MRATKKHSFATKIGKPGADLNGPTCARNSNGTGAVGLLEKVGQDWFLFS